VKQLQERVNELENHNKRKRDSVIFIKKSQACIIDKEKSTSSCEENFDNDDDHRYYSKKELPRVEARVIDKEILIGIHCEKQKDIVIRLMALLQNLHLSLASSSVLPFGTSTLKVTIIAQVIIKQYINILFSKIIGGPHFIETISCIVLTLFN